MPRLRLIVGALLNVALTLWPGLLRPPGRAWPLLILAAGVTALVLGDGWNEGGDPPRTTTLADARALRLSQASGLVVLLAFWIGVVDAGDAGPRLVWPPWLGLGLMIGGAFLRHVAIRTLGEHFKSEVTPGPGHRLVRSGIYAHLHHPSEAGLLMAMTGAALVLSSPAVLVVTVGAFVPLLRARLRLEEAELRRAYPPGPPDPWDDRMRETPPS